MRYYAYTCFSGFAFRTFVKFSRKSGHMLGTGYEVPERRDRTAQVEVSLVIQVAAVRDEIHALLTKREM